MSAEANGDLINIKQLPPLHICLPGTTTVVSAVLFVFVTELKATQVRAAWYGGVAGVKSMAAFVARSVSP